MMAEKLLGKYTDISKRHNLALNDHIVIIINNRNALETVCGTHVE